MGNRLDERFQIEAAGRSAFPGFQLRMLARTASTQDIVRAAARAGADAGFCCVAGEQTAGRGRQDRRWVAPAGSALLCSILVRVHPGDAGGVPLAAGLAVHRTLGLVTAAELRLKWPNDVIAAARKLAGILCEVEPAAPGHDAAVVVGIGINIGAAAAPPGVSATSLADLGDATPSAAALLALLLPRLAHWQARLSAGGVRGLREVWLRHASGIGSPVMASGPAGDVTGVAEGIDDDGALLVRTRDGVSRVLAGDVHLVPPKG